uniref:Dehydrogenase/reductase SDR family member 7B n=1 Tax=Neogobius melanostomus TaxID=47308 RepID=A0A8C6TB27_9GOBI
MDRLAGAGGGMFHLLCASMGFLLLYRLFLCLRKGTELRDAVVVITGASSGLGKECVKVFHAAGARLVLCGRDASRLQQVVQELTNKSPQTSSKLMYTPKTVVFDLADTSAVGRAAEEILACYGQVDVLINNAGISYRGNIVDTQLSVQREVMETNYFGPVALTQALLPSMIQRRSGHIVVISSVQGKIAIPCRSAYAASKHATQAYFDCLRAEIDQYGIPVTSYPLECHFYSDCNTKLYVSVLDKTTAAGWDPKDVAQSVFRAVSLKSKDVVLAGSVPTLAIYLRTLVPTLFFKIMSARTENTVLQCMYV